VDPSGTGPDADSRTGSARWFSAHNEADYETAVSLALAGHPSHDLSHRGHDPTIDPGAVIVDSAAPTLLW
jgi:hypothetical protein